MFRPSRLLLLVLVSAALGGACNAPAEFDMGPWSALEAAPAPEGFDGVTVTFLGVSTLVVRDGETTLLIDGFFTRPDLGGLGVFGKVAPDPVRVAEGLALGGVTQATAITTVHSHFDHAMDTPLVAEQTGAMVVASPSTANIARGMGLPEARIREVAVGDSATFGAFTMRWIGSKHYPLPEPIGSLLAGPVEAPFAPPARVTAWKQGRADTIVIRHPRGTLVVQGSAGFVPGQLDGVDADVVFLGIGGLGGQPAEYQAAYWDTIVGATHPARVYAVHWDDFNQPLSVPLRPTGDGTDFVAAMTALQTRAAGSGTRVGLLPLAVPVALY